MKLLLTLPLIVIFITLTKAQPFQKNESVSDVLSNVSNGCAEWVDYNLDGDFDIMVTGNGQQIPVTKIYKQDDGVFTEISAGLPDLKFSDATWADFDNDNDPDLFVCGAATSENGLIPKSFLFRNNNGAFEQLSTEITAVYSGSSGFGDLDNDGDYDLVVVGNTGNEGITKIFRNDGDFEFTEVNTGFVGIYDGEIDLGDYDNDLDIDIVVCGFFKNAQGDSLRTLKVYRNDGDLSFTAIAGPFVGMGQSNVSWWDYDNDGDLDIIANGSTDAPTYLVYIYQNLGNEIFNNIGIEIFGTVNGSLSCADYDVDGDQDFLLTGYSSYNNQSVSVVYRNVATNLFNKDYNAVITNVQTSSSKWCDYDNNGNLDVAITGFSSQAGDIITEVFDNKNLLSNTPPAVPENLNAEITGNNVILSWDSAADFETVSAGLTYNVRVGTTPGGSQILTAMTNSGGKRAVNGRGNAEHNTSLLLKNLDAGTYYFSVQSVDNGFECSGFSEEASFVVTTTGITEETSTKVLPEVIITPNPAKSFAVIEVFCKMSGYCKADILDNYGRIVTNLKFNNDEKGRLSAFWDLKGSNNKYVENGFYTVIVYCEHKTIASKIIVAGR